MDFKENIYSSNDISDATPKYGFASVKPKKRISSAIFNCLVAIALLLAGAAIDRLARGVDWGQVRNALEGRQITRAAEVSPAPAIHESVAPVAVKQPPFALPLGEPATFSNLVVKKQISKATSTDEEDVAVDVELRVRPNSVSPKGAITSEPEQIKIKCPNGNCTE